MELIEAAIEPATRPEEGPLPGPVLATEPSETASGTCRANPAQRMHRLTRSNRPLRWFYCRAPKPTWVRPASLGRDRL